MNTNEALQKRKKVLFWTGLVINVIAVLGIAFAIHFAWDCYEDPSQRFYKAVWLILSAIPASFGMFCSNRWVRSFAMLIIVGFVGVACYSLLFAGQHSWRN